MSDDTRLRIVAQHLTNGACDAGTSGDCGHCDCFGQVPKIAEALLCALDAAPCPPRGEHTVSDEAWMLRDEIRGCRIVWVDAYLSRRIDHREGDFTTEQYDAWEAEGVRIWNERHPAMLAFACFSAASAVTPGDTP